MSDDLAGWVPGGWLPRGVQLAQRIEAQEEQRQARQAERELAERCEQRRSADLAWAAQQAADRGQDVTALMVATGQIPPRSLSDVFADAEAAADREDARAEFEARRAKGERLVLVGELEPQSARSRPVSGTRRAAERTAEKFRAAVTAQQEAERARLELEDLHPRLRRPLERRRTVR